MTTSLLTAAYWTNLVQTAERGLIDFVTIEDSLGLNTDGFSAPDDRVDRVQGRLDAVLIAARVAPLTSGIGLVPTAVVTHTEPFHLSKAIATLDYVSKGGAGVRVKLSASPAEAEHFGRRHIPQLTRADLTTPEVRQLVSDLFDEAADHVEVVRRLWDSWEDDAEIRGRRHRPVHRPEQGALHRFSEQVPVGLTVLDSLDLVPTPPSVTRGDLLGGAP